MMLPNSLAPMFSDPELAALFADDQFIAFMLRVEVALAMVQAKLAIIPADALPQIERAAAGFAVDQARLRSAMDRDGILAIELVRHLREQVGGDAATYVHWGATSQDIMDTALVLQIRAALSRIDALLLRVMRGLVKLADAHRATLMAGRTHAQHALPITFGYKAATWLAPLLRDHDRLREIMPRLLVVQFGGAVGTLASLGGDGVAVQAALAQELGLGVPVMPWHTQRDNLVEFAGWLSLVTGGLAKMAADIILMAQSEIAEVRESGDLARGGSSTMPQKHNPMQSEAIIAAARTNAALLSALHGALIQEHERATGGWQVEWLTLPQMIVLTGGALNRAIFLAENLQVDAERMRANVAASNGLLLAEALDLALAPHMGREAAKKLVRQAAGDAQDTGRHLVDVVRERTDAPVDWAVLRDESMYLGSADDFIDRLLTAARDTDSDQSALV